MGGAYPNRSTPTPIVQPVPVFPAASAPDYDSVRIVADDTSVP